MKLVKYKKKTTLKKDMVQTERNRFTGHPKLIYLENQMFLPDFQTIPEWLKVLKGQRKTKIQL
jgi:hypothetical protein